MRLSLSAVAFALSAQAALADVTVFAAASLKTALDEIAADWTKASGVPVVVSYGGSSAMARQIAQGAPADIFISASVDWMDELDAKGMILSESRRDLLGNTLVFITSDPNAPPNFKVANGRVILSLVQDKGLSMALVDAVPAGQYGKAALIALGVWDEVKDRVIQSDNVTQAVRLVAMGEVPYGIAYGSDVIAAASAVRTVMILPVGANDPIIYPAALVVGTVSAEAAAFLDHLETPEAEAIFSANGFTPLP
jgi:molybdate transport system substrate-binding protein